MDWRVSTVEVAEIGVDEAEGAGEKGPGAWVVQEARERRLKGQQEQLEVFVTLEGLEG